MSIFDHLKKAAQGAAAEALRTGESRTFHFKALPESVEEMKLLPEAALTSPFETAALTVCALCAYAAVPEVGREMLNFLKVMLWKFLYIAVAVVVRVIYGNCNNLFVTAVVVNHIKHADWLTLNKRHRLDSFTAKHKNVKRVTVLCKGSGNKAVVCRIVS